MESIWSQSCPIRTRPCLQENIRTDVAVIGAGMAGILTAFMLQSAGRRVVVLEAGRSGGGQTGNTTAKITSQHGLIYDRLTGSLGRAGAGLYAAANEAALREYREIVEAEKLDCDFEERCSYVFGSREAPLRAEARAAAGLGLPAEFVPDVPLPFPAAGAVRFSSQAQFHPLKFLRALSETLTIYEHTPVLSVRDSLLTAPQGSVQAHQIVFACHYPFINFPGLYFARIYQERSYVLALKGAAAMDGMFIGAEKNSYSFRNYGDLLLLGGEGHRAGENRAGERYDRLRAKAAEWFPGSREVGRWSAQDCITPDSLPYIGRYASGHPDWYVATGFQKWGMTTSMVAALLLRDMLCGRENPYAQIFDPGRFDAAALSTAAAQSGEAAKGLAKRLFQIPGKQASQILTGQGGIVFWHGEKVGIYKDEQGVLYPVNIRCPHLGCQLEWNPDERSWDCPCHGSRFDYRGRLLSGPAQENLVRPGRKRK